MATVAQHLQQQPTAVAAVAKTVAAAAAAAAALAMEMEMEMEMFTNPEIQFATACAAKQSPLAVVPNSPDCRWYVSTTSLIVDRLFFFFSILHPLVIMFLALPAAAHLHSAPGTSTMEGLRNIAGDTTLFQVTSLITFCATHLEEVELRECLTYTFHTLKAYLPLTLKRILGLQHRWLLYHITTQKTIPHYLLTSTNILTKQVSPVTVNAGNLLVHRWRLL